MAGHVEAVGKDTQQFKPGDEVFGDLSECGFGAFSEYVAVPENALVHKPANLSFEESVTVPVSGLAALQALRDYGEIQPGQKVLINGASGGVGSFAILTVLKDSIEAGKLKPFVDRTYPLAQVPTAIRYVEERQVKGKVAISV